MDAFNLSSENVQRSEGTEVQELSAKSAEKQTGLSDKRFLTDCGCGICSAAKDFFAFVGTFLDLVAHTD
jgi:hypothetical protein